MALVNAPVRASCEACVWDSPCLKRNVTPMPDTSVLETVFRNDSVCGGHHKLKCSFGLSTWQDRAVDTCRHYSGHNTCAQVQIRQPALQVRRSCNKERQKFYNLAVESANEGFFSKQPSFVMTQVLQAKLVLQRLSTECQDVCLPAMWRGVPCPARFHSW